MSPEVNIDRLCQRCGARPSTHNWSAGGDLAWIHFGTQRWCERCVLEEQIDHAKKRAADLPALEARLVEVLAAEVAP